MCLYGTIYYRRLECRGIDEPYRIPHLSAGGRGAARAARPYPQSALPRLPGPGWPPHRFRAGAAHRRDLPRGDLPGLPPASPKLGGLLLLATGPAPTPQADLAASHRPRTLDYGRHSANRTCFNRPAVGRGLRTRGDPSPNRSGG